MIPTSLIGLPDLETGVESPPIAKKEAEAKQELDKRNNKGGLFSLFIFL